MTAIFPKIKSAGEIKCMDTSLTPPRGKPHVLSIVLLSDTHELHRECEVPGGDILIHAGDFTMFSKSAAALLDFSDWLNDLPHPHKIVVPGNHEFFLEADPDDRSLISSATVLINEGVKVLGLRFWGSPTTPLYGAAFGYGSAKDRRRLYRQIPSNTDILITHGPPYGILDREPGSDLHSGCHELLEAVIDVRPRLHVFGHVHGAYGTFETEHTTFANAALVGQRGELDRSPLVFQMTRG